MPVQRCAAVCMECAWRVLRAIFLPYKYFVAMPARREVRRRGSVQDDAALRWYHARLSMVDRARDRAGAAARVPCSARCAPGAKMPFAGSRADYAQAGQRVRPQVRRWHSRRYKRCCYMRGAQAVLLLLIYAASSFSDMPRRCRMRIFDAASALRDIAARTARHGASAQSVAALRSASAMMARAARAPFSALIHMRQREVPLSHARHYAYDSMMRCARRCRRKSAASAHPSR